MGYYFLIVGPFPLRKGVTTFNLNFTIGMLYVQTQITEVMPKYFDITSVM
jgi:hypothetical protein